ncbi:hypothetical protein AB0F72_09785 [Actinoplanes sp. NPDC023936]|uniref:hypothetical protein n=1 Tax=Actinoplanes sp. NPDC023936 TaxID=3154910 RepID=UPI0033FF6A7D
MIDDLVRRAAGDDDVAVEELSEIADSAPARLTPHHGLMLDHDLLWPAKLYRAADEQTVRRVIERVDAGADRLSLNHLLLVLAHSGHPLAELALRRWASQPPPGAGELHVGPLDYAQEGGWTIDADGSRRELCGDVAYEWLLRAPAPGRAGDSPDRKTCPWCSSPLWVAAELDFGKQAVVTALWHTGWSGRLVVETCYFCACYATVFSEVTPDGGASWWPGNIAPAYLPKDEGPEEPPALLPVAGPRRPSPFRASAWSSGGSTLGGRPEWIQDADHPGCPGCGQRMDYLGLIGGSDIDAGEGAYYLHTHQPCGFTAVNYQQS